MLISTNVETAKTFEANEEESVNRSQIEVKQL
jgi:hypothetical protein